jgi:hypothetical protein
MFPNETGWEDEMRERDSLKMKSERDTRLFQLQQAKEKREREEAERERERLEFSHERQKEKQEMEVVQQYAGQLLKQAAQQDDSLRFK